MFIYLVKFFIVSFKFFNINFYLSFKLRGKYIIVIGIVCYQSNNFKIWNKRFIKNKIWKIYKSLSLQGVVVKKTISKTKKDPPQNTE